MLIRLLLDHSIRDDFAGRGSWECSKLVTTKKERKKGKNEGRRRNIYLICKKFINLLVYENEKTNKKEILNHFEMTDRGIFRESCIRG